MSTLTEMVAAVVIHSSAVAFSQFGLVLDTPILEKAPAAEQRVVARTPRDKIQGEKVQKAVTCPEEQRARLVKA